MTFLTIFLAVLFANLATIYLLPTLTALGCGRALKKLRR